MTDGLGRPLTMWGVLAIVALVTRDELGRQCACETRDGRCTEVARWLVSWPGRQPDPKCQRHYERCLDVARVFGMADTIQLAARPLEVVRQFAEPEDPTEARFAAMELT